MNKNTLSRLGNKSMQRLSVASALLTAALANTASAQYNFVTQDSTTGEISFTPADLVAPIVTAVIAAIAASAALFVLYTGVRWLYKVIKGSK